MVTNIPKLKRGHLLESENGRLGEIIDIRKTKGKKYYKIRITNRPDGYPEIREFTSTYLLMGPWHRWKKIKQITE
jgi:hypothetical protein